MKIYYPVIFLVIFMSGFCFAMPSLDLQLEKYYAQETVIGEISGTSLEFNPSNMKIYEGRREIFFEKGIIFFEGKNYFYFIPTKQGNFLLEMKNILYNDSSNLNSLDINQNISIYENSSNSERITIRPGVYRGYNPEIYVVNSGNKIMNFSYNKSIYSLEPGKAHKINYTWRYGLNNIEVSSYEKFIIPIVYLFQEQNVSINQTNNISVNSTQNETEPVSKIDVKNFTEFSLVRNENKPLNISLKNLINKTLENISAYSERNLVYSIQNISLDPFSEKIIYLTVNSTQTGSYFDSLIFYYANEKVANISVQINVFDNETKLDFFEESKNNENSLTCEELGGDLCESNEDCSSNDFTAYQGKICCIGAVCTRPDQKEKSSLDYLVGILIFLAICFGAYFFYKRTKSIAPPKPEEGYKKIDLAYQKKTIGK